MATTLAALPGWEVYIQDRLATVLGFDIEVKLTAVPSSVVQVEELELAEEQRQVVAIIFVAHTMAKESILPQRAFQAS